MFTHSRHLVLISLLAALPLSVAAQSTEQPAQTPQPADPTQPTEPVAPADPAAPTADSVAAPETPAAPVKGQIMLQSENSVLAKNSDRIAGLFRYR